MDSSSEGLLGGRTQPSPYTPPPPLYHDSEQSPKAKMLSLAFSAVVILMVAITLILSIYRGATIGGGTGFVYFLMGLSLLGFAVIEVLMVKFVRSGDLPKNKTWFLYFVGGCTILMAIFTDVLIFK